MKNYYKTNNNVDEYDIVRVIGTILVVIGHSAYTTMVTSTGGIRVDVAYGDFQNIILLLVRLIYSFHMPMFIALSGALFYHTKVTNLKNLEFIQKKYRRLLIPFFYTGVFWLVPLKTISGYWDESKNLMMDIIVGQFIRFDNNHLWYVVSLFWIFLFFKLIYMIKFKKIRYMLIVISCIMFFVVGQNFSFNYFGLRNAMTHSIWFLMGILYERFRDDIRRIIKNRIYQLFFVLGGIIAYSTYFLLFKNNVYMYSLIGVFGIGSVLILSLYIDKTVITQTIAYEMIKKYSFKIYLLSDPCNYLFISLMIKFGAIDIYNYSYGCIGIFVARIIGTILVSILVSYVISMVGKKIFEYA